MAGACSHAFGFQISGLAVCHASLRTTHEADGAAAVPRWSKWRLSCRCSLARSRSRRRRRGASALEAALTLSILITLVLGMLDLGLWVARQQMLAHAARQIARQAVVHGSLADKLGKWGPTTITTNAV